MNPIICCEKFGTYLYNLLIELVEFHRIYLILLYQILGEFISFFVISPLFHYYSSLNPPKI